ncbi:MAG: archaeosortase/exosortase family protein [Verrucomicrobiota bacterium]
MTRESCGLGGLILLAIFIWARDLNWMHAASDTVPMLAGFFLFHWLGRPWVLQSQSHRQPMRADLMVASVIGFLAGIAMNLTVLLAFSWVLLLWAWLSVRVPRERHAHLRKLLLLPLLAFPWVTLDGAQLSWWFRLSGAWAAGQFFTGFDWNVTRHGTELLIEGNPIAVEAACSGMNGLQSMLMAGTAMALMILGNRNIFWWNIPLLMGVAWLANTLRIIALAFASVSISPAFASGWLHEWSGWLVLMVMFGLCWLLFSWQRSRLNLNPAPLCPARAL